LLFLFLNSLLDIVYPPLDPPAQDATGGVSSGHRRRNMNETFDTLKDVARGLRLRPAFRMNGIKTAWGVTTE
jgi:hypothetical protein